MTQIPIKHHRITGRKELCSDLTCFILLPSLFSITQSCKWKQPSIFFKTTLHFINCWSKTCPTSFSSFLNAADCWFIVDCAVTGQVRVKVCFDKNIYILFWFRWSYPVLSQSHVDSSTTSRKWIIFINSNSWIKIKFSFVLSADAAFVANVIQSIKVTKGSKMTIWCTFIDPQKQHTKSITWT